MSASIRTILILGGTSGIGEASARRLHAMGKKVIITGRREERLNDIKKSLPGFETYTMDNTDLASIPSNVDHLMKTYPDINTVWINGGINVTFSYSDPSTSSDEKIAEEIAANITGPAVLARHFIPKLLALKTETNFLVTSSALGYVPIKQAPVYCPTKSFIHSFMVGLRQELKGTNVNVIEIVPPFVATELVKDPSLFPVKPMPLEDFTNEMFEVLDKNDAKDLKEVAVGTAVPRVKTWRDSIGKMLESSGLGG